MDIGNKIGVTLDHHDIRVLDNLIKEYKPVYTEMVTKPTGIHKHGQNLFAKRLAQKGIWNISDIIRFYGTHTNENGEACLNWKNPALYGATLINDPVHTPKEGFQFNGVDNYLTHNWVPSVSGANYTQNSASQILYIRTDVSAGKWHGIYGCEDSKNCMIQPRNAFNQAVIETNNATYSFAANTDGSGLYINTRTAAAVTRLWRNAALLIDDTTASIGVPTHSPHTGAYNNDDSPAGFRRDQVFAELYTAGLVQAQANAVTDAINEVAKLYGVNVF